MKSRWPVALLAVSLAINVLLTTAFLLKHQPPRPLTRTVSPRLVITNVLRPIRTNLVFQPRVLTWQDIESGDYTVYIRNLRAIGCPEATVRDIIVADVNELFAGRRIAEVPNPAREWWRSEPSPELLATANARRDALDLERRELLDDLLGHGWEHEPPSAQTEADARPLDGEILGSLPPEVRWQVREIERRARLQSAKLAQSGAADSPGGETSSASRHESELRAELAKVLTPQQLEEYLLRYSEGAARLRGQLRGVDITPEDFRGLFGAWDAIDRKLEALGDAPATAAENQRRELESQRLQELERVLGPARAAHYMLAQDPVFQQTRAEVERVGGSADKLIPLYQFNRLDREERQRVLEDDSLSAEEQTEELAELYRERLDSLRQLLGDEAFRKLQSGDQP